MSKPCASQGAGPGRPRHHFLSVKRGRGKASRALPPPDPPTHEEDTPPTGRGPPPTPTCLVGHMQGAREPADFSFALAHFPSGAAGSSPAFLIAEHI